MAKAMPKELRVDSTLKNLINTTVQTRVLANQLLLTPNTSTILNDLQISMLLKSPVGSFVKNVIVANMIYAYLLHKHHLKQLEELLQKMGLKEEMQRYYQMLKELEYADSAVYIRSVEEEYQQQNVPRQSLLDGLEEQLKLRTQDLADSLIALALVHTEQNNLLKKLVNTNNKQAVAVMNMAKQHDVELTPAQALAIVPQANRAFRAALTPQEQIKALGLFNFEDQPHLNLVRVQNFMSNNALNTTMRRFDERVAQLNTNFSTKNEELVQAKLRCLGLEQQIDGIKAAIEHVTKLPAKPEAGIAADALKELTQVVPSPKGKSR